eukprot:COSAG06_NODE_5625_length_3352_cov_3.523209_2_plen_539_part_00
MAPGAQSWQPLSSYPQIGGKPAMSGASPPKKAVQGGAKAPPKKQEGALRDEDVTHGRIIGRGSSGVVREGTLRQDDGTVKACAIKTLHDGATEKDVGRFVKEFMVAFRASERCPRACRIFGSVRHEGALCLVMQLYPTSLHEFLEARRSPDGVNYIKPLTHEEAVALADQILEGLAQLHAEGIVVRDLKPGNILMGERGQIALSDYGLAAVLSSTLVTAQTMAGGGTPAYKAPEQYSSADFGEVTTTTDMWAFGCVVVELLTGFPPWRGKEPMEIMMSVAGKRQAPTIPTEAHGVLAGLLQACFSHNQGARPAAQQALAALRAGPAGASVLLEAERLQRVALEQRLREETARREQVEQLNAQMHAEAQAKDEKIAALQVQLQQAQSMQPQPGGGMAEGLPPYGRGGVVVVAGGGGGGGGGGAGGLDPAAAAAAESAAAAAVRVEEERLRFEQERYYDEQRRRDEEQWRREEERARREEEERERREQCRGCQGGTRPDLCWDCEQREQDRERDRLQQLKPRCPNCDNGNRCVEGPGLRW